jgi:formate dehydrogenase iron-sulfur subunit
VDELRERAERRVAQLHDKGVDTAYLYGADAENQPGTGGLNAFFLLVDKPEVYNLPPDPVVPTLKGKEAWASMGWGALGMALVALGAAFLGREVTRG